MANKYFGTDGIRGRVGQGMMTAENVLKLGWAVGKVLACKGENLVVIGKDTRISGYMFESALEAGLSAAGVNIRLLGPMPTPGIAYLTQTLRASAGIVISASHNPYYDNGLKFFSSSGSKLADDIEKEIEEMYEQPMVTTESINLGKAERVRDPQGRYIEHCKSTIPSDIRFKNLKIVIDCANGATYDIAPNIFSELGADLIVIGNTPDGININGGSGSTSPEALIKKVLAENADLGVAFDGDGDRVVMVDDRGEIVDGDELLYIIACSRLREGKDLKGIVGTLMTNMGMELALKDMGLSFMRTAVGDRYVLESMNQKGWMLGGESSGHIICLDKTTTGDGIVSALQVLTHLVATGNSLHEAKSGMTKMPQVLVNIPINEGAKPLESEAVRQVVDEAEKKLDGRGRVLLRASGTEPLFRVMVEAEDTALVNRLSKEIADVIEAST